MDSHIIKYIRTVRNKISNSDLDIEIGLDNVYFNYDKNTPLFNGVSLLFKSNFITSLLGANGTGKTTVLKLVAGYLTPQIGSVLPKDKEMIIGYSSSNGDDLNPFLKCSVVVDIINDRVGSQIDDSIFTLLGLEREKNKRIWQLSSGQKKKLSLIRAFLVSGSAILLDEPTSHLDIESQLIVADILKELKQNTAILITSHDLNFINELIDYVYILKKSQDKKNTEIHKLEGSVSYSSLKSILGGNCG